MSTQNPLRLESAAEASLVDERVLAIWSRHPLRFMVEPATDYLLKAKHVLDILRSQRPAVAVIMKCLTSTMSALAMRGGLTVFNRATAPSRYDRPLTDWRPRETIHRCLAEHFDLVHAADGDPVPGEPNGSELDARRPAGDISRCPQQRPTAVIRASEPRRAQLDRTCRRHGDLEIR